MHYVLLTDAAPLRDGGTGCQVLGCAWLDAMGERVRLIITHRALRGNEREQIEAGQSVPVRYYYNFGGLRLGRLPLLRRCLEWLAFLCVLPGLARAVRQSRAERIFALSSAAPGFLFFAAMLGWATGLPLDFYLVDDYEELVRQSSQSYLVPAVRFFERRFLRRFDRVFAISPGYVEHLREKYGQRAHWLPVPAPASTAERHAYPPRIPDERYLLFVGSVNFLYEQSLADLYLAIQEWNRQPGQYRLRLKLLTRHRPGSLLERLSSTDDLELVLNADDGEKARHLHECWAVFLPYSFDPGMRVFVATSFSYKFTDAISAGRPILVYGPPYASIPRYFREEGLPLVATSPADLTTALTQIEACDQPSLTSRYVDALARHHAPSAILRVLEEAPSTRPSAHSPT